MKSLTPKPNLRGRNRPLNIKWKEADHFAHAIGDERSVREAADWFNQQLPEPFQRSYSSISQYVNGNATPDDAFIFALLEYYEEDDPRYEMAADISALRAREKAMA